MGKSWFFFRNVMQAKSWLKVFCLCFFLVNYSVYTWAYPKESKVENESKGKAVKGTVVDDAGEAVIGASVKVQVTTVGSITDIDGNFSLMVPADKKLEVSYIGYETQLVSVPANGIVRVVLVEDAKLLDEVVVVGYGTQRVKDLTGAATQVKMDEIADLPGASLMDALAGQVIGLNISQSSGRPGDTGSFTIRHPAPALTGGTKMNPLVVIDDVVQVDDLGNPDMTTFNTLNHADIESMTVLKDASAAVYGARSSQGVLLIKTKRGLIGTPKISYSGKLDFSDAVSHAKTMSAYETGVFTNRMFRQVHANTGTNFTDKMYSDSELEAMRGLNYNWLDEAWSSSLSQRHSLNVNGGSDKVTYFAGISYQDQNTNLGDVQDFSKWTFRTGGEMKVASGLKLSASVAGYNSDKVDSEGQVKINSGPWGKQNTSKDYSMLRHMPKYIPWQVELVDPASDQLTSFWVSPWAGPHYVNTQGNDKIKDHAVWNYFANEDSKARNTTETNGYNANFSLNYDVPFVKGLSLKAIYAISYNNTQYTSVGDYYRLALAKNTDVEGAHLIGDYTIWDFREYGHAAGNAPQVIFKKSTSKSEQMNFFVTYNRSLGLHDLSVTGVVERGETDGSEMQLHYDGPWKSFNGVSSTAGTLNTGGEESYFLKRESGSLSYIGRANYKYGNRYLAEFLIRSDASTKFAPENYWGTFMSGSAGWVASEEKFFQNSVFSKYIDFFKLRYSLGKTGKDNVDAWRWIQTYKIGPTGGLGFGSIDGEPSSGAIFNGVVNRNIKWDTTIKQNIGIDLNVLSNRLSLTTDYFYDKTKDLLMIIPSDEEPIYIGANPPVQNYGKVDAWGWEFSVRWSDKIQQSFLPEMGPIRYSIGMDYGISWHKIVLGEDEVFDYPAEMNNASGRTGYRSPSNEYGMKVWKETSQGDGMLRTQEDIDRYWQYLTDLATAVGGQPSYLNLTSKSQLYPGMIAYQDIAGDIDVDGRTIAGPNGVISREHGEDYVKLANNMRHNINTKLGLQWGDFSWSAQIATAWGGYEAIYSDVNQAIGTSEFIYSQFSYMRDMFDPVDNPNGRYPSMAVKEAYGVRSDFWQVPSFRCYVRNMTFSYSLPKKLLQPAGVDKVQLNLTGNNLWDFYNPYPDHFRNMYDKPNKGYPTLRTWTLGVNVTF